MIDAEDRALLEASIGAALGAADPGQDVDPILADLDWLELLAAEPDDAVDIVFRAVGAANARSTALDDALLRALGRPVSRDVAVVLPPFSGWNAPGRVADGAFGLSGLATSRAARATALLAVCSAPEGFCALVLPASAVACTPIDGVDPGLGLHRVEAEGDAAGALPLDGEAWAIGAACGMRAAASELAGICRSMLDLARAHALEREQFGHPIAGFQAVRHRLADALVALESLEASLVSARDAPGAETAALAKALAARAARTVGGHCQQVLAGMGFTTEHVFQHYLKRSMALEGLFGSGDTLLRDAGRRLLARRQVETLIEL